MPTEKKPGQVHFSNDRFWAFADIRARSPHRNDETRHKAGLH